MHRVADCSKAPPSTKPGWYGTIGVVFPPDFDKLLLRHGWHRSRSVIARSLLWPVNEDRFQEPPAALSLPLPVRRAGGVLLLVLAAAPAGEAFPLHFDGMVQAGPVMDAEYAPGDLGRVPDLS